MLAGDRRKCPCCRKLFRPDSRNRQHQRYCSAPVCRAASKAASQARWRATGRSQGNLDGAANVARVQEWRSRHPGYWRKGRCEDPALQDLSKAQHVDLVVDSAISARSPLREILIAHPPVLIGLIAHLVGSALRDDILPATERLIRLGRDILAAPDEISGAASRVPHGGGVHGR
jgi:hypothetical protein